MNPVVLKANAWIDNKQTVTVTGVVANEAYQLIQPCPAASSQSAYYAAGILCISQTTDSLTFQASTLPTVDLTVYVAVVNVQGVSGEGGNLPTLTGEVWDVQMTSYVDGSKTVSYGGGTPTNSNPAWCAFTDKLSYRAGCVFSSYTAGECYIQIYFGEIKSTNGLYVLTAYKETGASRAETMPKSFSVYGSNNGTDWTKIKEFQNLTSDMWATRSMIFTFDFIASFSYMRFVYDEGLHPSVLSTGIIEFYI